MEAFFIPVKTKSDVSLLYGYAQTNSLCYNTDQNLRAIACRVAISDFIVLPIVVTSLNL